MRTLWANYNYSIWNAQSQSQMQLFQLKHWYVEPIETASTESVLFVETTKFSSQMCIIWANGNYFNWNAHSLSKLQLFPLKRA